MLIFFLSLIIPIIANLTKYAILAKLKLKVYGEKQEMMDTIRKAANNIVVKIIFAIIILSFIFTGIGFFGFGGSNKANDATLYIAKVDGEGISRAEFEARAKEVTSTSMGDPAFIKQLRRNVFYSEITNYLAYKFSQQLGANISNDQVKEFIRQQRIFFDNGKFSNEKYLDLLAANGYTPDTYGEGIRSSLQQQQVIDALINSSFVLPVDSEISKLKEQTRTIYTAAINPNIVNLDDVKITLEDEQKYYDEHQSEFYKKERVKFNYILNEEYQYNKKIHVSDDEVKQEFNHNIKDYTFPAKKSYSVIYIKDKQQADDIVNELASGNNFESIAKTVNQDNASPYGKNGSLGWFVDDDSLPQAFKDAHLNKIGQISNPIAVDEGYLIVKLDDIQPAKAMDFDYAKSIIESKIKHSKIKNAFETVEQKIQAAVNKNPNSLELIAKESDLPLFNSDWAYFNDVSTILRYPEVRDVAFSDEMIVDGKVTGKVSEMITVGQGLDLSDFVIQVVDYRPEGIAPFDEVKDEINKKLLQDIANSRFQATVNSTMEQLNNKGSSANVQFSQNYTLHRSDNDLDARVINMVFDLVPSTTSKRVYGVEYLNDKSATVVVLTGVNTPSESKDISSELLPLFMNNTYYYLAEDIRSKAKIEIMPDANL